MRISDWSSDVCSSDLDKDIIYEDNHLLAVNKRAGYLVQADPGGDEPLEDMVNKYLTKKYDKPNGAFVGVVHRLDRPVSGLILFAKTSKGLERMQRLFKDREIQIGRESCRERVCAYV